MQRIGVLFFIKTARAQDDGSVPIYFRVTIDYKRLEMSTKRSIDPDKWNAVSQQAEGKSEDIRSLNAHLKLLEKQIYDAQQQLVLEGEAVTIQTLKNKLTGKKDTFRSLVAIFTDHNSQFAALVNKEYAPGTLLRYQTSLKHTKDFLKWKYQVTDIDIEAINHEFITSYEFYLRSERKCNNNSAVKYIKNFKKIIRICLANGWLNKDPFINYKPKVKEVIREFLTEDELNTLIAKQFSAERINQVKDIFIFSCFTGLAYADTKKLKPSEISIVIDGEKWIFTSRQKTDTVSRIPLLPQALQIIEKYKNDPKCNNTGYLLPVSCNQKMNAYLKEIADVCGIHKQFMCF
jgi:site-specific recombinase XerD